MILVQSFAFYLQAHISLKDERDSTVQKLFTRHNLGPLPTPPFSDEVALNLTNRVKSRVMDLEKDIQEKKVNYFYIYF